MSCHNWQSLRVKSPRNTQYLSVFNKLDNFLKSTFTRPVYVCAVEWPLHHEHCHCEYGICHGFCYTGISVLCSGRGEMWNQCRDSNCSPWHSNWHHFLRICFGHCFHGSTSQKQKHPAPWLEVPQRMLWKSNMWITSGSLNVKYSMFNESFSCISYETTLILNRFSLKDSLYMAQWISKWTILTFWHTQYQDSALWLKIYDHDIIFKVFCISWITLYIMIAIWSKFHLE